MCTLWTRIFFLNAHEKSLKEAIFVEIENQTEVVIFCMSRYTDMMQSSEPSLSSFTNIQALIHETMNRKDMLAGEVNNLKITMTSMVMLGRISDTHKQLSMIENAWNWRTRCLKTTKTRKSLLVCFSPSLVWQTNLVDVKLLLIGFLYFSAVVSLFCTQIHFFYFSLSYVPLNQIF